MKNLFDLGNQYLTESDWKVLAFVKFCLCSIGILIGMQIPEKNKKTVTLGAIGVFLATYIPLMRKLYKIAVRES